MSKHIFFIPKGKEREVAQELARRLAAIHGLESYHCGGLYDKLPDINECMDVANMRAQTVIDCIVKEIK